MSKVKLTVTEGKIRHLRKLQRIGHSSFLFIPKFWIDHSCTADSDGIRWVNVSFLLTEDGGTITVTGIKEKHD